ncbi:MAG: anaerobic selenocysteine-containing dehydrogenase [Gammaproteobacteria bacterium]|jgi:anaerobic selenocysteine-containing dehydrogenase
MLPARDAPPRGRSGHRAQLGKLLTDPEMDPPIKWMMVYNANLVVTAANHNRTIEGLKREDLFTVVHEHFLTDTALYADRVLPAPTQFEHYDLMPSRGTRYVNLNEPAIEPEGQALSNTEVFRRLSRRMGYADECLHRSDNERFRLMLANGHPYIEGITYESLQKSGWAALNIGDFNPLKEGGFSILSGKCEFFSRNYADRGQDPLPTYEPMDAQDDAVDGSAPLQLVIAKTSHFLNSEYVNLRHRGTEKHVPAVDINPADAARRNIIDGDMIKMFNRYGEVHVRASVCDVTKAGIVYLPFNWWPETTANGQSANALTPEGLSRREIGSNAFDAHVEIQKIA